MSNQLWQRRSRNHKRAATTCFKLTRAIGCSLALAVQPLLNYLNRLPERAELRLSVFQDGGATWPRVIACDGAAPSDACEVASWPIGGAE